MKRVIVRKDSYYDSVFLMLISTDIKKLPGITEAVVAMGTEMNRDLIAGMGLSTDEVAASTANDLIIGVDAESEDAVTEAQETVDKLLNKKAAAGNETSYKPGSLDAALTAAPEANLAIISVPGAFAAREARKALKNGVHVMMFSDNVSVEDEVALKKLAVQEGLLMMGPDCGTAIINGEPICFANVVPRGKIGIVSASGTGLQEVSCLIADAGQGVSQALGTGGRDLKVAEVGGMMMKSAIQALAADEETEVILVISKPPLAALTDAVIGELEKSGKPCVVHFVGAGAQPPRGALRFAGNLTEAARMAAAIAAGGGAAESGGAHAASNAATGGGAHAASNAATGGGAHAASNAATGGGAPSPFDLPESKIAQIVEHETRSMSARQKYLRGMFVGGTLTDEAATVLSDLPGGVHSFDASDPALKLKDPHTSIGHTIVDLGEDVFTVGRPHPMIDPSIRTERMEQEALDEEVALWLLDVVLGYGSHDDPAGAIVEYIKGAKRTAEENKNYLSVIASITGTQGDPQGFAGQKAKLEEAGVVVMPSNYQASMLAKRIMEARNE